MKKYIMPTTSVVSLRIENTILTTSQLNMGGSGDAEDNTDLVREDSGWDIW